MCPYSPLEIEQESGSAGGLMRCLNCSLYFDCEPTSEQPSEKAQLQEGGPCQYHPGKYATPDSIGPVMMPLSNHQRWSCCKALAIDAPGTTLKLQREESREGR